MRAETEAVINSRVYKKKQAYLRDFRQRGTVSDGVSKRELRYIRECLRDAI